MYALIVSTECGHLLLMVDPTGRNSGSDIDLLSCIRGHSD